MKTVLALLFAFLVLVPVAADAAQDNRRQERSFQNVQRGANARAQRQQSRPQRQIQRQQARPQRQARAQQQTRPPRQLQAQQAQPQRQMRQQRAALPQNRRQANGDNGQFSRGGVQNRQGPGRAGPNRQAPNRFVQNGQGRDRASRNRQAPNRFAQTPRDNRQYAGRVGGYRNDFYNGRRGGNRYAGRNPNWNRGYVGGPRFYYRGNYRPSVRVRPYLYPRGYGYTTWRIGAFLPSLFFSAQYYYDDYYYLGLAPPPPGYRWVRYGPDLLLVNLYSGQVADVIYRAFYW